MSKVVAGHHAQYSVVGEPFAKGGCGRLFRTTDPAFVYKEYVRADKAPEARNLEHLVTIGRDVLVTQGRTIGLFKESSINWPVDLVRGPGGATSGVVLPSIPASCFEDGDVRGLEAMILARAKPPRAQGRIALLLRMAEILDFLDQVKLVHGDISGKNLAWSLTPTPLMYLIDCDGLMPREPPPVVGVATPGWTDPRLVERRIVAHDHLSDRYALALALYRGLLLTPGNLQRNVHGEWPRPAKLNEVPDLTLRSMLAAALENPLKAEMRPAPGDWVRALRATYLVAGAWNTVALAELDNVSNRIAQAHRGRSVSATPFEPLPPVEAPAPTPPPPRPTPAAKRIAPPPPPSTPTRTVTSPRRPVPPAPPPHAPSAPQPAKPVPASSSFYPPTSAPVASTARGGWERAFDGAWAVVTAILVLLLGGFATASLLHDDPEIDPSALGALAAGRIGNNILGLGAACAVIVLLGAGRRRAPVATVAVSAASVAVGAGWLQTMDPPSFLLPALPAAATMPIITVATALQDDLTVVAAGCGVVALLLAACMYRLLSSNGGRAQDYVMLPVVILALIAGTSAASSHVSEDRSVPPPGPVRTDVWIAQLASVALSEGDAALNEVLREVKEQVPEARVLKSDDYGSFGPGYWVIYYQGRFTTGLDVLRFCDSRGRTTRNECIGHFLSLDPPERTRMCLRDDNNAISEDCSS